MILDKIENIARYKGLSPAMDAVLDAISKMNAENVTIGDRVNFEDGSYVKINEAAMKPDRKLFEFHRQYIDVHAPLTGEEWIGIAPIDTLPEGTAYDAAKDCGKYETKAVNTVCVPHGYFCVCFPEDAHCPGIAEQETTLVKAMGKVKIS